MKRSIQKLSHELSNVPAWNAVTREFVRLPRRSPDIAFSHVYEPPIEKNGLRENLYLVGHIENVTREECILCNAVTLEARKTYYHSAPMSCEERFQKTLQHLNAYIRAYAARYGIVLSPSRFHISVLALSGDTLMVSEIGSVCSYLMRGMRLVEIGKKTPSEAGNRMDGLFVHFVRGSLMEGDIVLVATPHSIQPEILRGLGGNSGKPGPIENIEEHLASHTDAGDNERASAALIMTCIETGGAQPDAYRALSIPSRHASQEYRATSPALEKVLQSMFVQPSDERASISEIPHKKRNKSARFLLTARAGYMCMIIAGTLLAGNMFSKAVHINAQTHSRDTFNAFLENLTLTVHNRVHADASPKQKRVFFAALLKVAASAPDTYPQVRLTVTQLQDSIRRFDREMVPEAPDILADFGKLSVVFQPESFYAGNDGSYTVAERGIVQLIRIAPADLTPRLIILGLKASDGPIYAMSRTHETRARFAFLDKNTVHIVDPRTKAHTQKHIAESSKKLIAPDSIFVAGMHEFFIISTRGQITRAPLGTTGAVFLKSVPLPKAVLGTRWQGATVLASSLYLLTRDMRILRLSGEKIVSDMPIAVAEPLGDNARLQSLAASGHLAILDSEHRRIILITPGGKLVRQYRHELFADMRDIAEKEQGEILVLTGTHLLRIVTPKY